MNPIKAHPVISTSIILWGDDENKEHELVKGKNCEGSVIVFDKRQIWTVYPYKKYYSDTEYHGACEYKNLYIRLAPKDFKRIFGNDVVERGKTKAIKQYENENKSGICTYRDEH